MLLPTSVKRHCSGCKTAHAPSNQYFQLQLITTNSKEPSAADAMSAIISRMRILKGLKFNKKGDVKSSMTLPCIQGASHVLSECSDAGPSYSVESVRSHMGSEKLIPSPPHVEDILDWEWVNTKFKSDIAPQSQKMILSDAPLMSLAPYYCDVVKHSMKEAPLSLAPHQTPINKVQAELISRMSPYVYFRG